MNWITTNRQPARTALALILFIAAAAHFIWPEQFLVAMPPYLPFHHQIILITGVLELAMALGLMIPATIKISAVSLTLYFIAIIPAHLHVCLNEVPIFGISSPVLLWLRLAFQWMFIRWAWLVRKS